MTHPPTFTNTPSAGEYCQHTEVVSSTNVQTTVVRPTRSNLSANGVGLSDDDIERLNLRTGVARQICAACERRQFRYRCVQFKYHVPATTSSRRDGHNKCTRVARSKLPATPGSDRLVEARLRGQRGQVRWHRLSCDNRGGSERHRNDEGGMFHGITSPPSFCPPSPQESAPSASSRVCLGQRFIRLDSMTSATEHG